jgi:hypothetical protein
VAIDKLMIITLGCVGMSGASLRWPLSFDQSPEAVTFGPMCCDANTGSYEDPGGRCS